jgi:DNA-directed RNA polymerase subunit beta'
MRNHQAFSPIFNTIDENGKEIKQKFQSTAGRFLLANVLPKHHKIKFTTVDRLLTKKNVSEVIDTIFRFCGQKETVLFCDKIKTLGFKHAFKAGISFGKDDLIIPKTKQRLINETKKKKRG